MSDGSWKYSTITVMTTLDVIYTTYQQTSQNSLENREMTEGED